MLNLGQVVPVILDKLTQECLVVFCKDNHQKVYYGNYDHLKKTEYKVISKNYENMIYFDEDFMLFENIIHGLETSELKLREQILKDQSFILLNETFYTEITNPLVTECLGKRNIGFKSSLINFNEVSVDFILDNYQYSLRGFFDDNVGINHKDEYCFKISDSNPFLHYILDDRYIDLTAVLSSDDAKFQLKIISEILIEDFRFKVTSEFNTNE